MENKTKEHIESLYGRIKYLEQLNDSYKEETICYSKINQTLFSMIQHFEQEVEITRERKDYEFYKEGMVTVVKQKDSYINKLEKENKELKCKLSTTNEMIDQMTTKVNKYI